MRRLPPWVFIVAMLGFVLLYLPLVAVGALSFNASRHGQTWTGLTLQWYSLLFADPDGPGVPPQSVVLLKQIRPAFWNSCIVAVWSTAISTVLGTLLAIGLRRLPFNKPGRLAADLGVNLPTVTPDILLAAALVVAYQFYRQGMDAILPATWEGPRGWLDPGLVTLVIGHVTFQISFVAVVVGSRLAAIGHDQMEAARDLYASTWAMWRRVLLPQLAPGIVAGALLAFTLSLDDFVVSFFISGPSSTTLPILIYASVKRGVTPEIHALSTIIVTATMLAIIGLAALERSRTNHAGTR